MSYSLDNDTGLVRNSDGMELGHYTEATKTFTFLEADLQGYKAMVSRFLNAVGTPVDSWEVSGETPKSDDKIPPKPKMHPKLGDKTPAVVRWYEKYHLDEFKRIYKVKGRGVVPRYRKDHLTGETVIDRHEEVWLAERKTCLTELVNLPKGQNPEEMSYDASLV